MYKHQTQMKCENVRECDDDNIFGWTVVHPKRVGYEKIQ